DRNRRGHILEGEGRGCRAGDDHISLESNHLGRKLLESFCSALRVPALNDDVLSLNVAEFVESLKQGSVSAIACTGCAESSAPHYCRVLRPHGERPGRRAAEECDEITPSHGNRPSAKAYQGPGCASQKKWPLDDRFGSLGDLPTPVEACRFALHRGHRP